jgi:hypothetical protein
MFLIFINSFFQLIPVFYKDLKKELYIPYQAWFNLIAVLYVFLEKRKANYLYEETKAIFGEPNGNTNSSVIVDVENKIEEELNTKGDYNDTK